MAVGFETYDVNGKLQANGEMLTYVLRMSGTSYVENRKIGNTCPTSFLVPNTYSQALIAISGGNGYTAAFGGTYGVNGQYPKVYGTNNAPVGTPFNYFIFERSNTIPSTNFGLEVRNANNEITFSTSQRVMRVLNLAVGVEGYGGTGRLHYPGRQLAFCQAAWAGWRISGPPQAYGGTGPVIIRPDEPMPGEGGGYQYRWDNDGKLFGGYITDSGQTVGSTLVSFDDVVIGPTNSPDQPPDFETPLNLFIIDVTGVPIGVQFY